MKTEEHNEQREELLEAFKNHDTEAWRKYQSARLLRRQIVLEKTFEAELDKAAQQLAEELDDEVFANSIQSSYTTYLLLAGFTFAQATLMASSFARVYRPVRRQGYGF